MNTPTDTDSLFEQIAKSMSRDQFRFRRRLAKLQHQKNHNGEQTQQLARLERDIKASTLLRVERNDTHYILSFPFSDVRELLQDF